MKFCPHCSAFHSDEAAFCPDDGTALKPMQDPHLGKTIAGRYRLSRLLGTGGMAYVYLAHHVVIERLSALKILREDLARNPSQQAAFLREARAVNRINHPNIVEISDMGEADGVTYQVMEYVQGPSLFQELGRALFGWDRAVRVALQVAAALGRAHQMGVVHRDLKPENILLARRTPEAGLRAAPQLLHATVDLVKLTDFGVAKLLDEPSHGPSDRLAGTPGYIAPECLQGGSADPRADLYALGVVIYEMTTGALPFDELGAARLTAPLRHPPIPPRARRSDFPADLEALVLALLSPDPSDRPPTAFDVYDALVRLLRNDAVARSGPALSPEEPDIEAPRTIAQPPEFDGGADASPDRELTAQVAATAHHWHETLAELDASIALIQRNRGEPEAVERVLEIATLARGKVRALERASRVVFAQQEWVDTLEAEGREFRADMGRALDQLVLARSRERADADAAKARLAALDHAPADERASEARLWETTALEVATGSISFAEEDLTFQIEALEQRMAERNQALELQQTEASGALEGSLLAIRHLTHELSALLHEARDIVAESTDGSLAARPPPIVSVAGRAEHKAGRR